MRDSEGQHRLRIRDLFRNFAGSIEGIGGGDDGTEGHNGEADDGEVDRVRGEQEDNMAFTDAKVSRKRAGNGINGTPDIGESQLAAGGGVNEGNLAVVGAGGDEGGDIERIIGGKRHRFALAVEGGVGFAESTARINVGRLFSDFRH